MFCFHLIRDNLENLGEVKVHSVVHESFLLLLCLCGAGGKLGSHIWYPSLPWRAAHWSQASAAGSAHRPPSTPLLNHLCAGESQSHKTAVPRMSEVNTDLMTALLRRLIKWALFAKKSHDFLLCPTTPSLQKGPLVPHQAEPPTDERKPLLVFPGWAS